MTVISTERMTQNLDSLCKICDQDCSNNDIVDHDLDLFSKCLQVMQDDLAVSFEFLRLNSPADKVICNFRSFFLHVSRQSIELYWNDSVNKQKTAISPDQLVKCFSESLKRWLYTVPDEASLSELEQFLTGIQSGSADIAGELSTSYDELDSYPILEKTVATDCPECGEIIQISLDEGDLETIATGARMIHKAVEHESVEGIHVVNLFIDSDYKIRRKHAMKLVKAS